MEKGRSGGSGVAKERVPQVSRSGKEYGGVIEDLNLVDFWNEKFFKENEPRVHAFKRLAIIYKKQERYKEAIGVCKKAIRYDMRDGTKSGFEGRLERLKRELE